MGQTKAESQDRELNILVEGLVEERLKLELGSLDERIRKVMESQSGALDVDVLSERIEVSPFIQLDSEFGSPILIRKSAIVGIKANACGPSFHDGLQPSVPLSVVYTTGRDFVVRHGPGELLEALGQAEL